MEEQNYKKKVIEYKKGYSYIYNICVKDEAI